MAHLFKMQETIIIVHGEKPLRSGKIDPTFARRLEKALDLTRKTPIDTILVTGGKTRKGFPIEAETGALFLTPKTSLPIIKESRSKNTGENILYAKALLSNKKYDKLIVITSKRRIKRVKYLYSRLFQESYSKIEFVGTKDYYPFYFSALELLYLFIDVFDPKGTTLEYIGRRLFRNG